MGAIKSVANAHDKAYREIDATHVAKKHHVNLKSEIKKNKIQLKALNEDLVTGDKELDKERLHIVQIEEKCRKINQLIREKTKGELDAPQTGVVNENDLETLERQIKALEDQFKLDQGKYHKMHTKMEKDIKHCKDELDINNMRLREKEQECKIYDMKIRELKRSMPHKSLRPIGEKYKNVQSKIKANTFYSSALGSTRRPFQSTGTSTLTSSVSNKNKATMLTNLKHQSKFSLL